MDCPGEYLLQGERDGRLDPSRGFVAVQGKYHPSLGRQPAPICCAEADTVEIGKPDEKLLRVIRSDTGNRYKSEVRECRPGVSSPGGGSHGAGQHGQNRLQDVATRREQVHSRTSFTPIPKPTARP